jgi:hypothetical protein
MKTSIIRDYSEKRDFIRMKVDTEILLYIEEPTECIKGICRDLSGTGMLIEIDKYLEEETILNTSLPSSNDTFPSFETAVKVVRCTTIDNGNYMLGVEIIQK